jgi:hypothetical protein
MNFHIGFGKQSTALPAPSIEPADSLQITMISFSHAIAIQPLAVPISRIRAYAQKNSISPNFQLNLRHEYNDQTFFAG